jgi:ABC-2 type transport system permease protein
MNNNILMLIRREIWEHRALWIAPLVVAGVLLVIAALGGVNYNDDGNFWFGNADDLEHLPPEDRARVMENMSPTPKVREFIAATAMLSLTMVQLFTLGIVVFFYLLDTLLAERRDRSILFWKSLPISDGEVVTSKALTALVAAPLIAYVVSAVMVLLCSGVIALRMIDLPFNLWSFSAWLNVEAVTFGFMFMIVLWYLPLAGYLLVVSVWVRKNAFLWAVLPPVGLLIIEKIITRTDFVADFLGSRLAGFAQKVDKFDLRRLEHLKDGEGGMVSASYRLMGQVFADYEIWVGVVAGLALCYLAVRIRRFRDDS